MISPIHEDLKKKINFYDNYIIQYCVMYIHIIFFFFIKIYTFEKMFLKTHFEEFFLKLVIFNILFNSHMFFL